MRQDVLTHTYHVYVEGGGGGVAIHTCVKCVSCAWVRVRATKLTDLFRILVSPRASCTSLTDMALGRSCLLANTKITASRNSSSSSYMCAYTGEGK